MTIPSDEDLMHQALAAMPYEARCKACGYQLRGLTEPRCPECGLAFDPRNQWSYDVPGRSKSRLLPENPDQGLVAYTSLAAACLAVVPRLFGDAAIILFALGCGFWLMGGFYLLVTYLSGPSDNAANAKRVRLGKRLLLLTTILLLFHYEACRCDHARALAFGWIGIAYSPSHGPCHNPPFAGSGTHAHLFGHWWLARMEGP